MKRFFLALMPVLALLLATTVFADDWSREQVPPGFIECAFTPAVEFNGTIVDAALATDELSTLALAVDRAGLVDTLSARGPFTVYAPVNAAFDAIPGPILGGILADKQALSDVLRLHVVPGIRAALDPRYYLTDTGEVDTVLDDQAVNLSRGENGPRVGRSSLVSCQPVKTSNGIVYLIDSVLRPRT